MMLECPLPRCATMNGYEAEVCAGCEAPLGSYARVTVHSARLFNRGLAAARAERLTEARDLFAAVVHWCPLDVEARSALAMACAALGDTVQATYHWEQVLRRRADDPIALAGLTDLGGGRSV